jgi:copper chaperone
VDESAVSIDLAIEGMHCEACIRRIQAALADVPGMERVDVEIGRARIVYLPDAVSLPALRARIEALGYTLPSPASGRNPFRRFLDRMTETNEKSFGGERLDCCTLNRRKLPRP